jgi:Zn-dependent peptidase ImmA (M78 family)
MARVCHVLFSPFFTKDCPRIILDDQLTNEDRLAKKYRFTLGEEIAHFFLHPKIFADRCSIEERNSKYFKLPEKERKYIENNARALASALLMHKYIFENRVSYLLSQMDINTSDIGELLDNLSTTLGHDFDVNFSAAKSRLKMLGCHNRLRQDIN